MQINKKRVKEVSREMQMEWISKYYKEKLICFLPCTGENTISFLIK